MKTIQLATLLFLTFTISNAQNILESQVPSITVNNFKKLFPKASDVEWEQKGDLYNVEFEIGWFTDYEAWFSKSGKLIKYTKEINQSDLPIAIINAIETKYKEYRIDDVKKIVENGTETYKVELKKWGEEFDVFYSKNGKFIK